MNKRQAKKARLKAQHRRQQSYASKYFQSGAEMQSAVNRINNRIKTVQSHFGKDSNFVQNMYTKLDLLIPQENLYYKGEGDDKVLQIAKPYNLFKNPTVHEVIYHFDKNDIRAYGDIKSEYVNAYQSYLSSDEIQNLSDGSVKFNDIDEYILFYFDLMSALAWAYDNPEHSNAIEIDSTMKQSTKTYADLMDVVRLYQEGEKEDEQQT